MTSNFVQFIKSMLVLFLAISVLVDLHEISVLQEEVLYYKNLLNKEQLAFEACRDGHLKEYQANKRKELRKKLGYK